jgi:hypothetical protein
MPTPGKTKTALINKQEYDSIFNSAGEYIGYPIYQLTISWTNELGDPPTWTEATAQYSKATDLCKRCSELDLKELFKVYQEREKVSEEDAFEVGLGKIHDLLQNKCDLCNFFVEIAVYLWRKGTLPSDAVCKLKRTAKSAYEYTVFSVDCTDTELPDYDSSSGFLKTRELSLWRPNPRDEQGNLLTARRADVTPNRPWMPLSMIALLAQACINQHAKCAEQSSLGLQMKTQLFVINLHDFVLVPAPKRCKYVALSYVWGPQTEEWEVRPIKLSTVESLPIPKNIPRTIIHAMNVAKGCGFDYIWIDQLCIPEDARDLQIAEMDLVYRNGALTIIAAVENATSGLPGVGAMNRTRNVPGVLNVAGVSIGLRTPRLVSHAIGEEVWETRGWTYQEKVLSSRQLVFTEHEVFYKCLGGEKGEEACHQSDVVEFTRDSFFTWGELLSVAHGRDAWQIYTDCIGVYSKRNFTFESDILNAFEGIVGYFRQKYDWTFCWGLPDDNFALSLLWTSPNAVRRQLEDFQIPSWSWAGWRGDISYEGFRPKELEAAESDESSRDFRAASWEEVMLEEATKSGILAVEAECIDINDATLDIVQEPTGSETLGPLEDGTSILGCVFIAFVVLADARKGGSKESPYVRGLVVKMEGNVAYRVRAAGAQLKKWLLASRDLRSISIG